MGDIAVLHPQNILRDHVPRTLIYSQMKSRSQNPNPNLRSNSASTRPNRRKRSTTGLPNNKSRKSPAENFQARRPVIGQVKILKRGEELKSTKDLKSDENKVKVVVDLDDSKKVSKNGVENFDLYAGAAFVESPPPSSLPLPTFSSIKSAFASNNSTATTDLLRLLKLDF